MLEMKPAKVLIVIDMQNDFVTGALANPAAAAIIPGIKKEIKTGKYRVMFTRDTHDDNYLDTPEGKHLPIKHCIKGSHGWELVDGLLALAKKYDPLPPCIIDKHTFGSLKLVEKVKEFEDISSGIEVNIVGTCTDICVLNNALLLKTLGIEVNVISKLCAGLTPELHEKALEIMAHNHINII